MGHKEAIHLKQELENMYVCAKGLMMKPEGVHPLEKLCWKLTMFMNNYCMCVRIFRVVTLYQAVIGVKLVFREKSEFDVHAIAWISHNEYHLHVRSTKTLSVHGSYMSSSTKLKSQVKPKVVSTTMQQEATKVYETRLCAREHAKTKKQEIMEAHLERERLCKQSIMSYRSWKWSYLKLKRKQKVNFV